MSSFPAIPGAAPLLAAALSLGISLASPAGAGAVEDAIAAEVSAIAEGKRRSVEGVAISARDFIAELYALRDFRPIWDGEERRAALATELTAALRHGFRPEDFDLDDLETLGTVAGTGDPRAIAMFDIAATEAAARLLHHLYYGKVDPATLDADWSFDRPFKPGSPAKIVNQYLEVASYGALVDDVELVHPAYLRMQQGLQSLLAIAAAGGWPQVPDGIVLKPGMQDARIPALRSRLAVSGDVDGGAPDGTLYDPDLEAGVRAFQQRHGLEPDGVIGPKTYRALNRTVEERIDQMRVSLERARWTLRGLGDRYVFVNIGGAETFYVRDNVMLWRTRSVVGQAYRKTPVFQDEIEYIEINPTWTVPQSILVKDKLPRIRKDPSYLSRGGYAVVDRNGQRLDPAAVNWASDNPGVTLVQRPGPDNALGLVKFMFPNAHSVYLHDTNDRGLFDHAERNLSSGCVRIENPFELADLLLEDDPDWSPERRDAILASGQTTRIALRNPVPIVLTYYTAWVDQDGVLQFREDIYQRDEAVRAALASAVSG